MFFQVEFMIQIIFIDRRATKIIAEFPAVDTLLQKIINIFEILEIFVMNFFRIESLSVAGILVIIFFVEVIEAVD